MWSTKVVESPKISEYIVMGHAIYPYGITLSSSILEY